MSLDVFLTNHYLLVVQLLGLWTMLSVGVHMNPKVVRNTRITIILILLEAILWSWEYQLRSGYNYTVLRPLLTATIYILHPLILLGIIGMMDPDYKLFTKWVAIPLIVNVPLLYTSQWTHFIFFIDGQNLYHGNGIYSFLPYLIFLYYIGIFAYRFILCYSKYSLSLQRSVLYIVVVSLIGVIQRVLSGSDFDYATLFASAVILYYLFLYMHKSRVDTLTELWNRQCYYHDLNHRLKDISAFVSIDMNELKYTNDTYGHKAGDIAIKTVADALSKDRPKWKECYRVGGDEFIFLYFNVDEEVVKKDIEQMRENLKETKYGCAFGYAMMGPDHNYEEAMQRADRSMYADKTAIKKAILEAGGQLHRRIEDFE